MGIGTFVEIDGGQERRVARPVGGRQVRSHVDEDVVVDHQVLREATPVFRESCAARKFAQLSGRYFMSEIRSRHQQRGVVETDRRGQCGYVGDDQLVFQDSGLALGYARWRIGVADPRLGHHHDAARPEDPVHLREQLSLVGNVVERVVDDYAVAHCIFQGQRVAVVFHELRIQ